VVFNATGPFFCFDQETPMPLSHRVVLTVAVIFLGNGMLTNVAGAQDRLPPIPPDKMTSAQKEAIVEFRSIRGADPFGPFVPLMRSPELMNRASAMGNYLRYSSALPPRLSEFVILMTAREWTQQYEWDVHYPNALKAGLNPAIAMAIADGRRPLDMAEDEALLYDFCLELQRSRSISDATYGRMVSKFGEQGVIDTVGIVGYYTLLGMVLNTARTPLPAGVKPPLPAFPR
jgi:4-carboxymuconolactone decarboxylase